jgi:hypothetical protein
MLIQIESLVNSEPLRIFHCSIEKRFRFFSTVNLDAVSFYLEIKASQEADRNEKEDETKQRNDEESTESKVKHEDDRKHEWPTKAQEIV